MTGHYYVISDVTQMGPTMRCSLEMLCLVELLTETLLNDPSS